jgi:hypothetical protein
MIEWAERMIPLGTFSGEKFPHNALDFTNLSLHYQDFLKEVPQKEIQFLPISQNFFKSYVENIIPGGEVPKDIIDLFSIQHKFLYLLKHPKLSDEVVLGFDRYATNTSDCESAKFSLKIKRSFHYDGGGKLKLTNESTTFAGITYQTGGRLLMLFYAPESDDSDELKLERVRMSVTPEELPKFNELRKWQTGYSLTNIDNIFTDSMVEQVKHRKALEFVGNFFYTDHPTELGTFSKTHSNKVDVGIKIFHNRTSAITAIPLSLKKPREIKISLPR